MKMAETLEFLTVIPEGFSEPRVNHRRTKGKKPVCVKKDGLQKWVSGPSPCIAKTAYPTP
jgi:hypothetical protein